MRGDKTKCKREAKSRSNMLVTKEKPKLFYLLASGTRSGITLLFYQQNQRLRSLTPALGYKSLPPKAVTRTRGCGVAVHFELFFLVSCVFLSLHAIVSKMVNVSTFMSTTLDRTDPKKNICYIVCNLHVWWQRL